MNVLKAEQLQVSEVSSEFRKLIDGKKRERAEKYKIACIKRNENQRY